MTQQQTQLRVDFFARITVNIESKIAVNIIDNVPASLLDKITFIRFDSSDSEAVNKVV